LDAAAAIVLKGNARLAQAPTSGAQAALIWALRRSHWHTPSYLTFTARVQQCPHDRGYAATREAAMADFKAAWEKVGRYPGRFSIASINVWDENGLCRYVLQPASVASISFCRLSTPVIIIILRDWPDALKRLHNSMPDKPSPKLISTSTQFA
jgi:hypothetical protein